LVWFRLRNNNNNNSDYNYNNSPREKERDRESEREREREKTRRRHHTPTPPLPTSQQQQAQQNHRSNSRGRIDEDEVKNCRCTKSIYSLLYHMLYTTIPYIHIVCVCARVGADADPPCANGTYSGGQNNSNGTLHQINNAALFPIPWAKISRSSTF